ncbi:MAG: TCR/Tet family MFS transporter [Cyclobacteriaceae bacterium]|nr:TCR/Tet family MFS transporter [Cyclobacteriaceae bacterium HetDA_MAG_MS6]
MKNRKAALGFIFVTVLIDVTGLGIIIPVLPKLISELIGGTISDASVYGGWLLFVYAFFQFLFAPILGGLSDQYGRRIVLLIALFGLTIDYLFLALAPTIGWLFLGRIIAGIGGASFTTASAYIADISTPDKRAQNFGVLGAAFGLGFIVGPVIGGLLGELGSRIPFYAAAGLTFANWLYGYFVVPESLAPENRRSFSLKRANPVGTLLQLKNYPLIIGLLIALFFVYLGQHATHSTWAYFTQENFDWSEVEVGYSLGFVGLMIAIVQGVIIRPVIAKIGQGKAVYVGLSFNALGLLLIALATKGWMIFAIMVPYALGGLAGPALQGIMSSQVPANEQGELQGGMTSLMSVTSIIGPVLMTTIFHYYTDPGNNIYFPGAPFALATILAITSLTVAYRSISRQGH